MKAKRKPAAKDPDHKLIMDCVRYTAAAYAGRGAYKGDPDGDSKHAERIDDDFLSKARKSLKHAARRKAQSAQGLRAKARAVIVAIADNGHGTVFGDEELALCMSFAEDVERVVAGMIDQPAEKS